MKISADINTYKISDRMDTHIDIPIMQNEEDQKSAFRVKLLAGIVYNLIVIMQLYALRIAHPLLVGKNQNNSEGLTLLIIIWELQLIMNVGRGMMNNSLEYIKQRELTMFISNVILVFICCNIEMIGIFIKYITKLDNSDLYNGYILTLAFNNIIFAWYCLHRHYHQ